jgi:hypothetical protein
MDFVSKDGREVELDNMDDSVGQMIFLSPTVFNFFKRAHTPARCTCSTACGALAAPAHAYAAWHSMQRASLSLSLSRSLSHTHTTVLLDDMRLCHRSRIPTCGCSDRLRPRGP